MFQVKFKKLHPDAIIPAYAHDGDAGFDLCCIESCVIMPGETVLVRTGLAVQLPVGTEMQIRPRSGLALKTPYFIKNAPGTIDAGYRGELGIIVSNMPNVLYDDKKHPIPGTTQYIKFSQGDRIAQGVVKPVLLCELLEVDELGDSERGESGFGSTGINTEKE